MKIILASDGSFVMKYGYNILGLPKDQIRIGYITTASKASSDRSFLENYKKQMSDAGYYYEEFDIENKTEEEIRNFLSNKNVVHVEGGNTFYLLKAIRETGFAKLLKEFLSKGGSYIGTSAGAYIMCPTIEVANWNNTGRDRFGITDFTSLGYVPFVVKAHFTDSAKELVQSKIGTLKYPLRIMRDGQGIFINGETVEFMGDGHEIVITPEINKKSSHEPILGDTGQE